MSKYYLYQDTPKCIGCHACEVQCKANKDLPKGPKPCEIVQVGPRFINGIPKISYVFMPCLHCEIPWCVTDYPTGAMQKRVSDGIVFVDEALCVGCKVCVTTCPWAALQRHPEEGKIVKGDYCKNRVDDGQKPACVTICTTGCLSFGSVEEMSRVIRERRAKAAASLEKSRF